MYSHKQSLIHKYPAACGGHPNIGVSKGEQCNYPGTRGQRPLTGVPRPHSGRRGDHRRSRWWGEGRDRRDPRHKSATWHIPAVSALWSSAGYVPRRRYNLIYLLAIVLLVALALSSRPSWSQSVPGCGSLENAYGPFDYRDKVRYKKNLHVVEINHFTSAIERLAHGQTGKVPTEIDYTLRAFPNHHRALDAMSRYQLLHPRIPLRASYMSAECYFQRALYFAPDDPYVRLVYGIHFHKRKQNQKALEQYKEAVLMAPNNPELQYNLGLLYVDLKNYAAAKEHARKAYDLGYPLPGLKNRLRQVGAW